jgi:hypothetical protein
MRLELVRDSAEKTPNVPDSGWGQSLRIQRCKFATLQPVSSFINRSSHVTATYSMLAHDGVLTYSLAMSNSDDPNTVSLPVRRVNKRMAQRMAKRAKLDEQGVAVCFAYNNLATTLLIGTVEDVVRYVPSIGDLIEMAISILTFYFHRIVLVTESHVYVYRDLPFHIPGKQLASYTRHDGVVKLGSPYPGGFSGFIRRGQLTFEDEHVVYHSFIFIRRARYIAQEGNNPNAN